MTNYRAVARHVRYWRGVIHKWSTVYPLSGTLASSNYTAALSALFTMEQKLLFPSSGIVGGGIWEMALYNADTGGVPISVTPLFDPNTHADWISYTGTVWTGVGSRQLETAAETALQVEWPAGVSRTGKTVHFRKWYHSVPTSASSAGAQDIGTDDIASIVTALEDGIASVAALGAPMGIAGRLAAMTPEVSPFYGNHQMPRGRRKLTSSAKQSSLNAILKILEDNNDTGGTSATG